MANLHNERFLPGRGTESRWKEGSDAVLSFQELLDRISVSGSGQIFLMEGPTGCGKSLMIRKLRERMPDRTVVFSSESIADYCDRKYIPWKPGHYAGDTPDGYDVVCIEDVDFIRNYHATVVSRLILELVREGRTVVVNGIDCCDRAPELFQNLQHRLHIFHFVEV